MAVDVNDKLVTVEALLTAYNKLYCGLFVGQDGYIYQTVTEEDDE